MKENLKGATVFRPFFPTGSEMRAFNRLAGGVALTGYGPNINIARDPRFGRNSGANFTAAFSF
jgi:hypothetical protein